MRNKKLIEKLNDRIDKMNKTVVDLGEEVKELNKDIRDNRECLEAKIFDIQYPEGKIKIESDCGWNSDAYYMVKFYYLSYSNIKDQQLCVYHKAEDLINLFYMIKKMDNNVVCVGIKKDDDIQYYLIDKYKNTLIKFDQKIEFNKNDWIKVNE